MATISSDMEGGARPRLHLFDLPQEIRDQIYGHLVSDTYLIVPSLIVPSLRGPPSRRNQGDDFRHLSILGVSKRANWEAVQLLQRKSWFIYKMPDLPSCCRLLDNTIYQGSPSCCRLFDTATTRHMMNVQIVIDYRFLRRDLSPVFLSFAGTKILRQTCLILVPNYSLLLMSRDYSLWRWFRRHLQHIKSLTDFNTVVVQVTLKRFKHIRRGKIASDEYCTKLLMGIIEDLEPAVGPAMPCDPVQGEEYDLNFKFSPIQFAAEQSQRRSLESDTGA